MKRRSLLLLSLLAFPGRLFGQDSPRRTARSRPGPSGRRRPEPARPTPGRPEAGRRRAGPTAGPTPGRPEATPANFPNQAGFRGRTSRSANYTALDPNGHEPADGHHRLDLPADHAGPLARRQDRRPLRQPDPAPGLQHARRSSSRSPRSSSGSPTPRPTSSSVRVRFIAAADSRWRYAVHQRLTPVGSGPQGQQIWHTSDADAEMVITQMQVWQGFKLLGNTNVEVLNGQTLKFTRTEDRPFTGGVQRDERGRARVPAQGREAGGGRRPPLQPAPELRGRHPRRRHRAVDEPRPQAPPGQGARPLARSARAS